MKKILLSLGMFAFTLSLSAQTPIFSEDFEGVTVIAPDPQSPLTGSVPAGWTVYDEDGNTMNSNIDYIDEAWKILQYSQENGNVAMSGSWYSPAGQSDDWIVTPQISLPNTTGLNLLYDIKAQDPAYPDNYELLISTTGNTPSDFVNAPILAEVSPEGFETRTFSLDTLAGQDIYIAFRNVAYDKFALVLDNVRIIELNENDVAVTNVDALNYFMINTDESVMVNIENLGSNVVSSVKIDWTDGTDAYSHEYTGLSIASFSSTEIELQTPLNYSIAVEKEITVTVSEVNTVADTDPSNNEGSVVIHTIDQPVTKKVVIEEGTGTWCGYCPRGIVAMEYFYNNPTTYPNFIGIAVHEGNVSPDPMEVYDYAVGASFSGFPGSNVDRVMLDQSVSTANWNSYYNQRKDLLAPAELELNIAFDENTRAMVATVNSEYFTTFSNSNLRLGLVVVEDGVSGSGSTWNQVNYYAGGANGPMGGFENRGDPATGMVYDRVGRALIGGFNGEAGSVPTTINTGDNLSYDFNYTLPSNFASQNVSIVALLIDQETGAILNAAESPISTLGIGENELSSNFKLFPNPATDQVNVTFSNKMEGKVNMNIYSLDGKVVQTKEFNIIEKGEVIQINTSNLVGGEYMISFSTPKGAYVKNLIVK